MFTLPVSCWLTSNLPWFMDLTFQVPINIALCIRSCFHHESHPQLDAVFASFLLFCFSSFFLELLLHWSPVAYWAPTNLGSSSFIVFLPFRTVHGVLKAKILKWLAIPFTNGPHFVRTLQRVPSLLGGPTGHGSQFHWVRQGCDPCN